MLYFKKEVIFYNLSRCFPLDDSLFFNSFAFNEFTHLKKAHIDNSAGARSHFIGYMKAGSGVLISSRIRLTVTPGDLFYIPKGCRYHSYWNPEPVALFDSLSFDYFPNASGSRYQLQKLPCNDEVFAVFQPLSGGKAVTTAAIGRLYTLLGMLQPEMELDTPEGKDALTESALSQLHRDPNISVAQLAATCNVSEATLYNTFRRRLNKTPNQARLEILCQKAAQLLITTGLPVEEVSRRCGFSSASYFRKVLFSVTGKTPRQIRAEAERI